MAINFPATGGQPTDGSFTYTAAGITYSWNGESWTSFGTSNIVVNATGSGISVQEEGSSVGIASTINFVGTGVTATFSSGIATVTITSGGGGVSIAPRTTASASTGSIGVGTAANITITGYKTYALQKVGISSAAWVTIYTDASSRTADASRSSTTDPDPGSGVIAEVLTTTSGISTFIMSPGIIGWNNDATPSTNIYAKVVNNESSTSDITVTLTLVQLES
jgi:hypothetical protein